MPAVEHIALRAAAAVILAAGAPAPVRSASGDGQAGNAKLVQCFTCHGQNGIAKVPDAPNLAGQNETYLAKALNDYKTGARKHEVMSLMAAPLSSADIAQAASYFSSIPFEVKSK